MARLIAIGDIHGCSKALARLIEAIGPEADDVIVTLGDYINRGVDSKGVLDLLIELQSRCRLVALLGNHEEMLLANRATRVLLEEFAWIDDGLERFPTRHFAFLERCQPYHETQRHIFLHANYQPGIPLDRLDGHTLRWLSLRDYVPTGPHCSGKTVIVGHTPQASGEILDLGYLRCIDTNCCNGGWLTALDVESGQVWQVNERGEIRQ